MIMNRGEIIDKPQDLNWESLVWQPESGLHLSPPRTAQPLTGMENPYLVVVLLVASSIVFLGVFASLYVSQFFGELPPTLIGFIVVLGLIFEGGVALFMKSKIDKRKRLVERGEVTKAYIQSIETIRVGKGVQRVAKVIYQASGTYYQMTSAIPFKSTLSKGAVTSMIYDPIEPNSAILYEGCGFKAA